MSEGAVLVETEPEKEVSDLRFVMELPSRRQAFLGNLRDLLRPRAQPPLRLTSAPAPFWTDVFVDPQLPWRRFVESGACHVAAILLIWAACGFLARQAGVVARNPLSHDVLAYTADASLPPLDTRRSVAEKPAKADPEISPQPIISVPREADNRSQTVVAPPDMKLKENIALPNVVAWTEHPRMPIAPVPVIQATSISRLSPSVEDQVVAPAPNLERADQHRNRPGMQAAVIAPPPEVQLASQKTLITSQAAVIAPPPSVVADSTRRMSDINIGRGNVIAPAPRLALDAQRAGGRRSSGAGSLTPQVVAPPPALRGSSSSAGGGRMVALNLHPAVGAPPAAPAGNRRGSFAATPEGHRGATGTPGASDDNSSGSDSRSSAGKNSTLPSGLYVGKSEAGGATSAVAGASGKPANTVNPNLIANAGPPRTSPSRTLQPGSETRLSQEEREVFHDRKFYSLTLNMPNLNSAGGSWIIRFAELKQNSTAGNPSGSSTVPASDLSAPAATRKVDPAYPLELMKQNVSGTVILFGVIHADGTVSDLRVLRSVDDRLDQYASEALSRWQFQPATKNGTPVDVEATFQIPFRPGKTRGSF